MLDIVDLTDIYYHEYGNCLDYLCKLPIKPCTIWVKPSKAIILMILAKNIVKK